MNLRAYLILYPQGPLHGSPQKQEEHQLALLNALS